MRLVKESNSSTVRSIVMAMSDNAAKSKGRARRRKVKAEQGDEMRRNAKVAAKFVS